MRVKRYSEALEQLLLGTAWCFDHGSMYKEQDGWYLANLPKLGEPTGVVLCLSYKPEAIDALFWEITGLSVDLEASLPFRNQVPFAIQAPEHFAHIGTHLTTEEELASLTIEWTDDWFGQNQSRLDVDDMLEQLGERRCYDEDRATLAICLFILKGDLESASEIARGGAARCHGASAKRLFSGPWQDGPVQDFFDKARDWLATEQRKRLKLVP